MKRRILASAGKAGKTSENNGTEQKPERLKSSRRKSIPLKPGDFALTALVMMLVIFGVIMVFSASYYYAISKEGTPYYYLIRDIIWAVVGTAAMMFMAVFDYHKTQKMAIPVLGVVIVLLLLVFTPLGVTINNATRWIGVGGATIMPGELAKPACILFVAAWLSHPRHSIRSFVRGVLPPLLVAGVAGVLIAMQPSTTTAATLIIIVFGMMFIAGMSWAYVGGAFGLAIAAFAALIVTDDSGYRMKRILSFTDPFADPQGTGYQVVQSLLALGSGGLTGVGLGKSMQKTLYLPEPQNDFIFSVIGEEFGFVGCVGVLALMFFIIIRCIMAAMDTDSMRERLIAVGVAGMLAFQTFVNVGVATGIMPNTGMSLPFVSSGGSSLWTNMAAIGLVLNIKLRNSRTLFEGEYL